MLTAKLQNNILIDLTLNGHDFSSPDADGIAAKRHPGKVLAYDRSGGGYWGLPAAASVSVDTDGAGCSFVVTVQNNRSQAVSTLEVQFGSVFLPAPGTITGLPDTQSVWASPKDPPALRAPYAGGVFYAVN